MKLSNRTLVQKVDLALSELTTSGGVMLPGQAQKLMIKMIAESKLFQIATFRAMKSQKEYIDQVTFGSRIMQRGTAGQALAEALRSKPDLDRVELDAKLIRGEVRIDAEVLEDNIEKEGFTNTLRDLIAKRCKRDVEYLLVRGDTSLSGVAGSDNDYLSTLNGMLKQATSHTVDASDAYVSKAVFRDAIFEMPEQWKENAESLDFLTATDVEVRWRDIIGDRIGLLGDELLQKKRTVAYGSIPVLAMGTFPQNVGTSSHCANVILTDPKNIHVGVHREIKIKMGEDISADKVIIVVSMRVDIKYLIEDAVVKVSNVKV